MSEPAQRRPRANFNTRKEKISSALPLSACRLWPITKGMNKRFSKKTGKTDAVVASLVLQRGLIGTATQWYVHAKAFLTGRQSGPRTCAGLRRTLPR